MNITNFATEDLKTEPLSGEKLNLEMSHLGRGVMFEDELKVDPNVVILNTIVEDLDDPSVIWNIFRKKILPEYSIWTLLLEKAQSSVEGHDLKDKETIRKLFLSILNETETIVSNFKTIIDNCLVRKDISEDGIHLSRELCRAFEIPLDSSLEISTEDGTDLFITDENSVGQAQNCHLKQQLSRADHAKRTRKGRNRRKIETNSQFQIISYDDQDECLSETPLKTNKRDDCMIEDDVEKKLSDNEVEKPSKKPFKKNPIDKRYYCTVPGCSAGDSKNWTCSSGVWKHFISEHAKDGSKEFCIFPCDSCERRFPTKALLNQHQKEKHISHFEFVCTVCAKRLPTNVSLQMHMRMHTGEKPFSCDLCNYRSIRQAAVNQHKLRMHVTEPRALKHVCDKCGKTFKEKSKLKEHIKTHSDARSFLCVYCGKGLKNRQSLNRHQFTHGLKNECPECGKYFSTPATLNIHQRDKHGMTI